MRRKSIAVFVFLTIVSQFCLFGFAENRRAPIKVDLLIIGGTVVTMDDARRVIEDGAVAIESGKIAMVGKRSAVTKQFLAKQTINARGKVIIPGLINTHTHVPMSLF